MGDINWDKVSPKKLGTSQSPNAKILKALGLKKKKGRPKTKQRKNL